MSCRQDQGCDLVSAVCWVVCRAGYTGFSGSICLSIQVGEQKQPWMILLKCGPCSQRKQRESVLAACLAVCLARSLPRPRPVACMAAGRQHRQRCRASSVPPPGWCQVDPRSPEGNSPLSLSLMSLFDRVSVTQMASASEGRFGTSIWLLFIFYLKGCGCGSSIPQPLVNFLV